MAWTSDDADNYLLTRNMVYQDSNKVVFFHRENLFEIVIIHETYMGEWFLTSVKFRDLIETLTQLVIGFIENRFGEQLHDELIKINKIHFEEKYIRLNYEIDYKRDVWLKYKNKNKNNFY